MSWLRWRLSEDIEFFNTTSGLHCLCQCQCRGSGADARARASGSALIYLFLFVFICFQPEGAALSDTDEQLTDCRLLLLDSVQGVCGEPGRERGPVGKKNFFIFICTIQQPAAQRTEVEETCRACERWGRLVRPFTTKVQHAYKLGWGGDALIKRWSPWWRQARGSGQLCCLLGVRGGSLWLVVGRSGVGLIMAHLLNTMTYRDVQW